MKRMTQDTVEFQKGRYSIKYSSTPFVQ